MKKTSNDLTLEDIKELGGGQEDLDLIQGVDAEGSDLDYDPETKDDNVKTEEIQGILSELGLGSFGKKKKEKKEKKEKTLKTKEVKKQETQIDATTSNEIEKETKKKKKKNKFKVQHDDISSTTEQPVFYSEAPPTRSFLLCRPGGKWTEHTFDDDPPPTSKATKATTEEIQSFAARLFEAEVGHYQKKQSQYSKSDMRWINTVLTKGTLSDKVAALTLLVEEAPVHNIKSLDTLIGLISSKGRREALKALDTLKGVFMQELLPSDRKLRTFTQHPLMGVDNLSSGNKDSRDKRLIIWYFEDQLKQRYQKFLEALEVLCRDNIFATKQKALNSVYDLLSGRPEQEKILLSILCNKLGDPEHKLAAKATHLLTKLVGQHPNMKPVIVSEVERLMYRPNVSPKAQYYAVCFLNHIILSENAQGLASRLITIYFSLFKAFVKKGEIDTKMLCALLTGVNRAFPYSKVDPDTFAEQLEPLYKIIHITNFNTGVQALMLLHQVAHSSGTSADRYYQSLYKKMADPGLAHSSKQTLFLNLLFKSLKGDEINKRVKAFVKRLLQLCASLTIPFTCGSLILLSELMKMKPSLFQFTQTAEDLDDDEDEHFADIKDEETDEEQETEKVQPDPKDEKDVVEIKPKVATSSWVHRKNVKETSKGYNPLHWNPLYAGAESQCVWELQKLASHCHPTVALFASTLLKGQPISYQGDPLRDFTLIKFLDRFVYRNPKKAKDKESKGEQDHFHHKNKALMSEGAKGVPVNSKEYLEIAEEKIPVDERFFYKYFARNALKKKKAEPDEEASDAENLSDTEIDSFLDKLEGGQADEGELDWDFAEAFSSSKSKDGKGAPGSDSDDDSDDDFGASDDEDDLDLSGDEDFGKAFEESGDEEDGDGEDENDPEFDEEAVAFSDDDFGATRQVGQKRKSDQSGSQFIGGNPRKKGKKSESGGLFAAAEDFGDVMDMNADSAMSTIGSNAMIASEKTSAKQLQWEAKQERFMKGLDRRQSNRKPFNKGQGHARKSQGHFKKGQNFHGKKMPQQKGKGKKGKR